MYCSSCGKYYEQSKQKKYCSYCGARLDNGEKTKSCRKIETKITEEKTKENNLHEEVPEIKNLWVWLVAFVPLLGLFLKDELACYFISSSLYGVLCLVDMLSIKHKVTKQGAWLYSWLLFVPLYL